ncbi:hypothetical protein BDW71DRAFT_193112 [Aspergillus fruticulosus]
MPQQRKLLEVVYEVFESAGATLQQVSGSDTTCFIATFTSVQQMLFKEDSFQHSLAATGVDLFFVCIHNPQRLQCTEDQGVLCCRCGWSEPDLDRRPAHEHSQIRCLLVNSHLSHL